MKETQCERVLKYIQCFGSINTLQGVQDLGCMRLASRIHDLKRMGYPVRKRSARGTNRYGEVVYFAEYYMQEGERINGRG